MKHKILLSLVAVLLTALSAQAYDFQSGALYYNTTSDTTVEVAYQSKSSDNYQGLTTATIPETVTYNGTTYSVTSIGKSAFKWCSSLTSVTIPNSVTSIEYEAFELCSSLTSVTIPNSVTSIGNYAFNNCFSLTSVTIPNSVTSIGYYAFYGCSSLTSISIPNSVTSIGKWAFSSCSSLTSVTIPTYVTSIGECAFAYCSSLTSIVVESSNTMYDSRENCNAIIETASNTLIAGCQSTTIPNSVTSIGESAFRGCSFLTSVTIPNSVTSIGESAFRGCSSLTSISIPNSVTSIGKLAFKLCSSIADIYCYATTPPVCDDDNTFSGVNEHCYIHVPAGTIPNYQVATGWSYFSNFLEISEEAAISETEQQNKSSRKIIRDGQVLILRNGVTYDMMGNTL